MRASVIILALLLAVGCQNRAEGTATAEEAIKVTNRFWAEEFPQVNLGDLTSKAVDLNDRWRVTYDPPEGSAGAQWIFEVDKKSGKIVKVSGGQ
jgi:hypothetical protein